MQFKFIGTHVPLFKDLGDEQTIIMKTERDTCAEIIDSFADFLLGCGYHPKTVAKSLLSIGEERGGTDEQE